MYAPLHKNVVTYGAELSYHKELETLGEHYFYENSIKRKLYHMNIAAYPGVNLTQYAHDQIVYMNYIQHIVHHETPQEQEIAQKKSLLSEDRETVLEAFEQVITGLHGWWT